MANCGHDDEQEGGGWFCCREAGTMETIMSDNSFPCSLPQCVTVKAAVRAKDVDMLAFIIDGS